MLQAIQGLRERVGAAPDRDPERARIVRFDGAQQQAGARRIVAFADAGKDRYVALSGTAQPVDDPARKQRLWSKMNEAWFPNGPDDPDVALVQVRIDEAEYWDVKESKLVQMLKMARSAATGHPPADLGDHGRVRMH